MTRTQLLAIVLLIPFTALTAYTLYDVGFIGVFQHQLASSGGWQVFADLTIALILLLTWLLPDARRRRRNPWPYLIITLIAGSFGPLLYLAFTPRSQHSDDNTQNSQSKPSR